MRGAPKAWDHPYCCLPALRWLDGVGIAVNPAKTVELLSNGRLATAEEISLLESA